ncbi:unnamed protein product, partial [Musa hybrid cultivar]
VSLNQFNSNVSLPPLRLFRGPSGLPPPIPLGTSTWRLSLLIVAANNLIRGFLRRRISPSLCSLFVPPLSRDFSFLGSFRLQFCHTPGNAPVYLNVYDLPPMNGYMYWAGLGIFHTGVEVHGVEYVFGAHDYPGSGVFEVEPRQCPGFMFKKSIFMGTTCLDSLQAPFAKADCLITAVQHDPDFQSEDGERRQLRTAFSCLSSISMCQRQFTISSLFLTSPFRGCLSHWELRRSNVIPL